MRDVSMIAPDDPKTFNALPADTQQHVLDWIAANLIPIQSFNTDHTSYGLKHLYQHAYPDKDAYLTNGEFKGAMLKAGFKVKDVKAKNWCFNISKRSPAFIHQK